MNATPHTLAGITSLIIFKDNLAIGCAVATCSHLLLDYINESGLTFKERIYYDALPSLLLFVVSILTGNFMLFLLGNIFGNLPDLIDKKLYLSIFFPAWFKSTLYLHWQKPIINPSPVTTKIIGVISAILIIIILI